MTETDTPAPLELEPDTVVPQEAATDETLEAETTRSRIRLKPILWSVSLLVLVMLAVPIYSTLQPSYYERYPATRVRIENWRNSTHAKMSCPNCHMDPGVGGFLSFSARAVPAFYSQLVFGPGANTIMRVPSTAACQKCHTTYREVSPAGDLLIPHRAHVEVLKVGCPVCHKNLVHSLNAENFNAPVMSTCLTLCHDGVKATNQCVKCHTQKQVPASHHRADWLQIHSTMTETVNCGRCHDWSPNWCVQCHKQRPSTHAGNWKQLHQFRVAKRGSKGCLFCHGQAFCKKCH